MEPRAVLLQMVAVNILDSLHANAVTRGRRSGPRQELMISSTEMVHVAGLAVVQTGMNLIATEVDHRLIFLNISTVVTSSVVVLIIVMMMYQACEQATGFT